jgi:hypothetical protein
MTIPNGHGRPGSLVRVRPLTAADIEKLERAKARRLPPDVIDAIAATNGGGDDD